jgi:hypothetical protein
VIAEIRLYIEGGGNQKDTRIRLRKAFGTFLREIRDQASSKRIGWHVRACGARKAAYDNFVSAIKLNPHAFNVLLVDAEGPVAEAGPWEHLRRRKDDQWRNPGAKDDCCHLMVQTMEAWLIADLERLAGYYEQGFRESAIPRNANVEQIDKTVLEKSLHNATRQTQKGPYHKTRHAPEILEAIRASVVRTKATGCDRLFVTLAQCIERGPQDGGS